MAADARFVIIGAGIVGLSVGLEIIQRFPGASVVIFEKESCVANHQTGHNSGVVHSGIYYKPGSLKSRLCVEGAEELLRFCRNHDLPFQRCGKVIVATADNELSRLDELFNRGHGNGLKGLRMLSAAEIAITAGKNLGFMVSLILAETFGRAIIINGDARRRHPRSSRGRTTCWRRELFLRSQKTL